MKDTDVLQTILLDRLKIACQQRLSAQVAHDARPEAYVDHFTDAIVVGLQSYLYKHTVDRQELRVPFSKTETVEVPGPRWIVAAFALLAFVSTAVGALAGSLPVFLLASMSALIGVVVYAVNPPRDVTLTAAGEVVVNRELFNAFPDNTMIYPGTLGAPVRMARLERRMEWETG